MSDWPWPLPLRGDQTRAALVGQGTPTLDANLNYLSGRQRRRDGDNMQQPLAFYGIAPP